MKKIYLAVLLGLGVFILGCNSNDNVAEEEFIDESIEETINNDDNTSTQNNNDVDLGNLAREKLDAGAYAEAIDLFNKAIELDDKNINLYVDRGRAKRDSGDPDGALEDENKALNLNQEAWVYRERGITYKSINNKEAALKDFQKALSLAEGDAEMIDLINADIKELDNI